MNSAFLLIGGNLGNRENNLKLAKSAIENLVGKIIQKSSIYETAAWGNIEQPAFLNQVLLIETNLEADQLLKCLLEIEESMGRVRKEKFGPRSIDLDILFYNNEIISRDNLIIPHPQLQNRRFALLPMHEIAPNYMHPVLQKTITELLLACEDQLPVEKL